MALQDLILEPAPVLGRTGLLSGPDVRRRGRRRHDDPRHLLPRPRSAALAGRLRPALAPSGRRPLRREPQPGPETPPVPGHHEAVAGGHPGRLRPEPPLARHRPRRPRPPLRRGQLGIADDRRLGGRLAGDARRPRDLPVHLFPAVRRHRPRPRPGRDHLRPRAAGDVPGTEGRHLRPRLVGRRQLPRPPSPRGERVLGV